MKVCALKHFFIRFTPDQSSAEDSMSYQNKIYDIVNEEYFRIKTKIPHQFFGVFEQSKKGVLHFHFCMLLPMSENTLRKHFKERLNCSGNAEFSIKEYPMDADSISKSLVYMCKGSASTILNIYNNNLYYEYLGVDHYSKLWVDHTPQKSSSKKEDRHKTQKIRIF